MKLQPSLLVVFALGCSTSAPEPTPSAAEAAPAAKAGRGEFAETFDAGDWASSGSNEYFVLEPGHVLEFDGKEHGRPHHLIITVLPETKVVGGVETRVVEERETEDGELAEVSRNYFAFSKKDRGVYYFGEDVDEYDDGVVKSHGGSWHAGENGARYGLMMPGTPLVGARFYQEHAPHMAMDRSEITSVTETLVTAAGKFERCVKVRETTPLEKGVEWKVYAPGVGLAKDGDLALVRCSSCVK